MNEEDFTASAVALLDELDAQIGCSAQCEDDGDGARRSITVPSQLPP
jgi:hypothetical protein